MNDVRGSTHRKTLLDAASQDESVQETLPEIIIDMRLSTLDKPEYSEYPDQLHLSNLIQSSATPKNPFKPPVEPVRGRSRYPMSLALSP